MSITGDAADVVSVRPGVGMLALFPSMKYKAWYALGELVDNAIQSYLSNRAKLHGLYDSYKLRVEIEIESDRITVSDNAAGIERSDIARAFAPAQPPPDRGGLSQYGIGMKSAACWYAKKFTVRTSSLGDPVLRSVEIDIPSIVSTQSDQVDVATSQASAESHGTVVVLQNLNQPAPTGRTLGKIRSYLGSIYRGFIRNGELELVVGGQIISYSEPAILIAPRWNDASSSQVRWRKDVDILLPRSGRRIRGWAAIREKGSTTEAGLALLYRGKVVMGAGSMANDTEGSYRPDNIFGRSNSFAYQRLFGEIDVSSLSVAYSKDDVVWSGEEEDFVEALAAELDAEPLPLIKMANGYRKSDHAKDFDAATEVRKAVAAAASAVKGSSRSPTVDGTVSRQPAKLAAASSTPPISAEIEVPELGDRRVRLTVVTERFESRLLRIVQEGEFETIRVNRAAPFMLSFVTLPNGDVEPLLRLCLAIGLAEIQSRVDGVSDASAVRSRLNQILEGPLSTRMELRE